MGSNTYQFIHGSYNAFSRRLQQVVDAERRFTEWNIDLFNFYLSV